MCAREQSGKILGFYMQIAPDEVKEGEMVRTCSAHGICGKSEGKREREDLGVGGRILL
jgi:hypothetical protein